MIISKNLTGILSMLWMLTTTASIAACAGEHITKNADNGNYANASAEKQASARAAALLSSHNQEHHSAGTPTELLDKSSQVEARHFAVYARYRQLVTTSSGSGAVTSQDGNAEHRASGSDDLAEDVLACPDPRQAN